MYYATLKKIESNHNNLRSTLINGLVPELPVVGNSFFMYSNEVLTKDANLRYISTSEVQEVKVEETGEIIFKTNNSLYSLSNIEKAEPASTQNGKQ